jgi:glycosyltransferase involved in cell wall biosynthesis
MPLREGITVGRKSLTELRELYACSRFVVVPLQPSNSDNGITTCLDAMAMGRAVICTRTAGQIGALEDGVNSIRVPPHDTIALRRAIERLWSDPELCAQIRRGRQKNGRRERYDNVQVAKRFAAVFKDAVDERRSATGL